MMRTGRAQDVTEERTTQPADKGSRRKDTAKRKTQDIRRAGQHACKQQQLLRVLGLVASRTLAKSGVDLSPTTQHVAAG